MDQAHEPDADHDQRGPLEAVLVVADQQQLGRGADQAQGEEAEHGITRIRPRTTGSSLWVTATERNTVGDALTFNELVLCAPRRALRSRGFAGSDRFERLLPVRHPDVLDLRRLAQELVALRPARGSSQSRGSPCVDPGALQVAGRRALDRGAPVAAAEVPDRVDVVVLGERPAPARRASPVTMLTTPAGTSEVSSTW